MEVSPPGQGLGKKFYGELMRRMPNQTLESDYKVSPYADAVWHRMQRRPELGYQYTLNDKAFKLDDPKAIGKYISAYDALPGRRAVADEWKHRASLPAAAALPRT
jgi:hypothetical protein